MHALEPRYCEIWLMILGCPGRYLTILLGYFSAGDTMVGKALEEVPIGTNDDSVHDKRITQWLVVRKRNIHV